MNKKALTKMPYTHSKKGFDAGRSVDSFHHVISCITLTSPLVAELAGSVASFSRECQPRRVMSKDPEVVSKV